jgi:hypothetical protein
MIKPGISSGQTHFDSLRRRIACLTSKSEIEGSFEKSDKIKRELFGITIEEGELKMEENDPPRLQQYIEAVLLHFHQYRVVW